jgi:hypothetical protein
MVDISTVSIVVASAGVLVAAIYYVLQLRHQNRIRQTDLVMRLYSQACSKEAMEAFLKVMNLEFENYKNFVEKYGSPLSEKPEQTAFFMQGLFYEGIGVLLHRKLVDIGIVDDLFPVDSIWGKVRPIVEGGREQFKWPSLFEWFEYLYNEVKKREQQAKIG